MKSQDVHKLNQHSSTIMMRCLLVFFILGIACFELFIGFRGLFEPAAMDQAQIARNVARGEGMTTQFFRPLQVMDAANASSNADDAVKRIEGFDNFGDANHAPLHIYALAGALKMTGYDDFEASRMEEGGSSIYEPDRVIAATSMVFFLIALFLSYIVLMKLFDEAIASSTILFMTLSDLWLGYGASGLPQPMMLCFLMAAMYFLIRACDAQSKGLGRRRVAIWVAVTFAFVALLCLTSWMAIWVAIALIIFVGAFLRPYGAHALIATLVLIFLLIFPYLRNVGITGSLMGNSFYSFYNHFGQGEDLLLRSTLAGDLPLDGKNFVLRLFGFYFGQLEGLYTNLGSIIVAPFFFLSIFNVYRNKTTDKIKWATFIMWGFVGVGMAFFGANEKLHVSQIYVLLTPFFTAYGLSLVFSFLAKSMKGAEFRLARNFTVFLLIVVSSGPLLFSFPKEIYRGLWLAGKGVPHWPPYYPNAMNVKLVDETNEKDIIVTDQPWAVAWYADRKALWTPLKVTAFTKDLLPIIQASGCDVQGFLATPSSFYQDRQAADAPGGLVGVLQNSGEFAPLSLEGMLLLTSPKKNFLFADLFDPSNVDGVGSLISSKGIYGKRVPILGAQMLYYAKVLD